MATDPPLHAIVPAGGAGTRLWPLSRRGAPKFLLDLTGSGRTLLQQTVDRLGPLTGEDGVVVVTGHAHVPMVAAQLPRLRSENLLPEPAPRDSMAAIGLAAAVLRRRHGDVVVGSFAADHVIGDEDAFRTAVQEAVACARAGYLTTIGVEADRPATAFGYIRAGAELGVAGAPSARAVRAFTEKPDAATAQQYLSTGEYRWNAGMFVVRAEVLLEQLAEHRPALHDGLLSVAEAWDTPGRQDVLDRWWPRLERVAIDHAVAEPVAAAGGVAVVPARMGWDDVGDYAALAGLLPRETPGAAAVLGQTGAVLTPGSPDALVAGRAGRTVAVLGIPGAVVVDTGDVLLVTTQEHAQDVRSLVDAVRERGLDELL
ncbi:mannose-1-phosphate guanylyltransferase [Georgenia sp. 10Sc9-8]|uniref:Mannose-1-phosphate guanylyltransferase n=1 Tax=Georgenia halotolerans TaxID=3028317 RepID=A0ABT5U1R7_9MICO|nr:mannose-1-phosphate guanylyltransferase [Georgenia halotolerans]